jgi:hemolysin activation/secretion protein
MTSCILLCALPVKAAPVVPDAGQTIRELQQQPELPVPESTPPLQHEEVATPEAQPNADVRMMVKSIHISGNTAIATAELEALLVELVGSEHTLAELNDGAERITAYYHERGYIVSRAYIPPQEIKDGAVMINVLEGRIGEQRINNQSRLSDQSANEYLNVIKSGDVLQAAPVDRAMLLLNETPGVGAARATLQPGASVGSADLVVELSPSEPYYANIQLDNYGNYYTGENRLGAELAWNSPLMLGDLVTLRALVSDEHLTYAYIAYQIPVGGSGLRVGGTYSGTRYRLGKELTSLQTQGTATIGSFFAVYPFIRSQKSNLSGTFTLENKQLNDEYVITSVTTEKQIQLATFGMGGDHRDAFGGSGITLFNLSFATGSLRMDDVSLSIDKLSAQTEGSFARLNYSLDRLQRLNSSLSLWLALSGQLANKNLNSSEQFSLGGAYGVRAYPQGEAFGDEGLLATVEMRYKFTERLQGVMFFDAGSVIFNHDPYPPYLPSNKRSLSGGGAGVDARIVGIDIKAYVAVRGSGGQPASEPANMNNKSRLWLQLGKYF